MYESGLNEWICGESAVLPLRPPSRTLTELTLVDDEAIFGKVLARDASTVSAQQEQHLGWGLSDGLHSWLVAQIQRCNLTGHPVNQTQTHSHQSASEILIKATKSISLFSNTLHQNASKTNADLQKW